MASEETSNDSTSGELTLSMLQNEDVDEVRKLVAEEGRTARNLLLWNVPLEDAETSDGSQVKLRKPPVSPRTLTSKASLFESSRRGSKRCLFSPGKSRIRSASAGRDPKLDFKARYWTFLFDNLRRAVDEIYETCETDNSVAECKEAIMVLENYTKDFHSLIEWIHLKRDYDSTPIPNRPTSLAWEIRRPSYRSNLFFAALDHINKSSVQRSLKFGSSSESSSLPSPRRTVSFGTQTDPVGTMEVSVPPTPATIEGCSISLPKKVVDNKSTSLGHTLSKEVNQNSRIAVLSKSLPPVPVNSGVTGKSSSNRHPVDNVRTVIPARNAVAKPLMINKQRTITSATSKGSTTSVSQLSGSATNARPAGNNFNGGRSAPASSRVVCASTKPVPTKNSSDVKHGSVSSVSSASSSSQSWADKVRGAPLSVPTTAGITNTEDVDDGKDSFKQDDDTEGWETVQRVRSKFRPSPPHKLGKEVASNTRSNSISGFEMYSERTPVKNLPSLQSQTGQQYKRRSCGSEMRDSKSTASTPGTAKLKNAPKPAKSLPSLHITVPESDRQSSNETIVGVKKTLEKAKKTLPFSKPSSAEIKTANSMSKLRSRNEDPKKPSGVRTVAAKVDALKRQPKPGVPKSCKDSRPATTDSLVSISSTASCLKPTENDETLAGATQKLDIIAETVSDFEKVDVELHVESPNSAKSVEKPNLLNEDCNKTTSKDEMHACSGAIEEKPVIIEALDPSAEKLTSEASTIQLVPEPQIASNEKVITVMNDSQESLLDEFATDHLLTSEDDSSLLGLSHCEDDNQSETTTTEDESGHSSHFPPIWGDCIRLDSDVRQPGHVLQIHEKLSSPSRKRPLSESKRRHEEKQAKAQEQREKILEEKVQKMKEINKKLEESRQRKEEFKQLQKQSMEFKMLRAEEKRRKQLQIIVRKAHDEEEKVNEIAFINSLEAQNKRHDVMSRIQGHEARLQDLQEERHRRQEEKAAKEAAAEERRRALEAERQAKLKVMQERRQQKQYKIEQHQQEKEKERQELAREKARDREERLSALQAAQQATVEELQKKIQQKQENSARRHEENIEHIKQRALEFSIMKVSSTADDAPRLVPYETKKLCTLCNVLIGSEVYLLSHLRGKKHQLAIQEHHHGIDPSLEEMESYNLKHVINAPADKIDPQMALDKERQKALKKRCKKLRHRMAQKGNEYENSPSSKIVSIESEHRMKIQKCIRDMSRCFQNSLSGPWPSNLVAVLDRALGEASRHYDKKSPLQQKRNDQFLFRHLGGLPVLTQILNVLTKATAEFNPVIPSRTLVNACHLYQLFCEANKENCHYLLASNRLTGLLDLLVHQLNLLIPDNCNHLFCGTGTNIITSLPVDHVAKALMQLIATILNNLACDAAALSSGTTTVVTSLRSDLVADSIAYWTQDIISYAVSVGIVDKLSQYFNNVRSSIDNQPALAEFLQQGMAFLLALTKLLSQKHHDIFEKPRIVIEDSTQLVATLRITDLVGTVSLLYGMLLHSGAPSRGQTPPPQLSQSTLAVTTSSLYMLNHFAVLDLHSFQSVVGGEGISLEFRHIVSYLLWYCSHWPNDRLLHELILIVDYFVVLNHDNQMVIQSGHMPSVLQQLCLLPFQYFSDPALVDILFPTLISSCFQNEQNVIILEQEVSCELLAHYIEEKSLDLSSETSQKVKDRVEPSSRDCRRWCLECRFPRCKWDEAQQFFHSYK